MKSCHESFHVISQSRGKSENGQRGINAA